MRRIVIVGCGFGGLNVARRLADELSSRRGVELTVVSERSHFFFTPLWSAVAGGVSQLSQVEIPLRSVLDHPVRIALDRARAVDLEARAVVGETSRYPFDFLVLAPGTEVDWRGNDHWMAHALPCKTGRDAVDAMEAFEQAVARASRIEDRNERIRALTFVVAGGGPTGVELMAHLVSRVDHDLAPSTPELARDIRLVLAEPQESLLPAFTPQLGEIAQAHLRGAGVELRLRDAVVGRTAHRVELASGDAIGADTFFWCGGVRPPRWLGESGFDLDDRGRVLVHRNLQAVGQHAIYVVGDVAGVGNVPMKADVAASHAEVAAKNIVADLAGRSRREWTYRPENETLDLGRNDAAVMWGGVPMVGRSAFALRGAAYGKFVPGALRKLTLLRDLFGGAVTRRAIPTDRLLEG